MSTILARYDTEPKFPATDQNAAAARYAIGGKWYDALGGQPTQVEVDAFAPAPTPGDLDRFEKAFKALALCVAQVGGLTVAQMKALFKSKWDSL